MVNSRLQEIMKEFQCDDAPDQLPYERRDARAVARGSRHGQAQHDDDYSGDDSDDDDYDDADFDDFDEPLESARRSNSQAANNNNTNAVGMTIALNNNIDADYGQEGNIHDQLPDPDEYKAQLGFSRPESRLTRLRRKRFLTMVSVFALIALVAIVIGTVIGKANGGGKMSSAAYQPSSGGSFSGSVVAMGPTPSPTTQQVDQSRVDQVMSVVQFLSSPVALTLADSPQQQAVMWIANNDPRQVVIGDTVEFKERYALAVLYFAMGGNGWEYTTSMRWMGPEDMCAWNTELTNGTFIGVDCMGGPSVRSLILPGIGLINSIPDEIAILSELSLINFSGNHLKGRLNPMLRKLVLLQSLELGGNLFSGAFPDFFESMPSLTFIDLSHNKITGDFPFSFANLDKVTTLKVSFNLLYDSVDKFAALKSIKNLIASDNNIYGTISTDLLTAMPSLEILDLSSNLLRGTLPQNLFEMPKLSTIDLHSNFLDGTIPKYLANPSPLKFLSLGDNALTGDITWFPTHFPKTMEHLDLANNSFSGRLPAFGEMTGLNYLFLAFNQKFEHGPIPLSLTRLTNIVDLSLQATSRTGVIPDGFGNLKQAVLLDFADNILTGSIPSDLGDASSFQFLFLNQNILNGTIPQTFSQLSNLNMLLLEKNSLKGDTNMVCEPKLSRLQFFASDCHEVNCPASCCALCCTNTNGMASGSGQYGSSTSFPTPQKTDFPTPSPNIVSSGSGGSGLSSNSGSGNNSSGGTGSSGRPYSGIPGGGAVAYPTSHPTKPPSGRRLRLRAPDGDFIHRELQVDASLLCGGVSFYGQFDAQFENEYKRVAYDFNQYVPSVPVGVP